MFYLLAKYFSWGLIKNFWPPQKYKLVTLLLPSLSRLALFAAAAKLEKEESKA
jgi:hypothetical protein